jgi:hypothetical protein
MILIGDFNMPEILWEKYSLIHAASSESVNFFNSFVLTLT